MAWIDFWTGTCASMALRKRMNSWCRVALHVAADDGTVEDVESSEQRGRTVAFVVVDHRSSTAPYRQTGLGAVERLDLALLIDREDDGMGWWIDIEAYNIAQLVDKLRVGGELELFHSVRLKAMRTPVGRNSR
jgi:hypothetical protein